MYPRIRNFGDEMTPQIIKSIWGRQCEWADPTECEMAGAGSIIEMLQERAQDNPVKIWGSGFLYDGPDLGQTNLDIYAVRGRLSQYRVAPKRKIALGDPGILASLAFHPDRKITHKVGVVYHYNDTETDFIKSLKDNPKVKLISPLQHPERVVSDIVSCELILSSSLHGLIVADSFKVPNYWIPLREYERKGDYKFKDYYSVTGRDLTIKTPDVLKDQRSINQAIAEYKEIVGLRKMQRGLVRSFPIK